MIIHGGEPPFVENPEPRFGEVLLKLDEMTYAVEQKISSFNGGTKDSLLLFSQNLAKFITDVVVPIDEHLNKVGPVHGENKGSVGLGLKDNYRTATLAEQTNLSPVSAYVTPQGAKQAFITRNANNPLVETDYQLNDVLQVASYYYVNEFPTLVPTVVQGVRYFNSGLPVAMAFSGDRVIYSPQSDRGTYQTDTAFLSGPAKARKASRLAEIPNLQSRLLAGGWNNVGGVTSDNKVSLFKPLAEKKIFVYKDALGNPAGPRNFLLYNSFVGTAYKGLSVLGRIDDNFNFTLLHKFFKVDAFETDPTLTDAVTSAYQALYTKIGQAPYQASLQGGHGYDIRKFITLASGQSIKIGSQYGSPQVNVSLMWASENYEIRMYVTVPVIVTGGGVTNYLTIGFMVSIVPGTLLSGGTATVTQLGTRNPVALDSALAPPANAEYVTVADIWDFNAPGNLPGVVLDTGDILRAVSVRNGIRVKRYRSEYTGLQSWLEANRRRIEAKAVRTELYAPARHSPFGAVPERIIPITNLNETTKYLVYGLDSAMGVYRWAELTWDSEDVVGSVVGSRFGVRLPTNVVPYPKLDNVPQGLTVFASKSSGGFGFNSLVFTTENGYRAYSTFGYAEGVVTLGAQVTLGTATLSRLQGLVKDVMTRAKARNPAVPDALRDPQIQVYALSLSKAVVILTDGYSYAEGGALSYNVNSGTFDLNFIGSTGMTLVRLTETSNVPAGTNRASKSEDGVWNTGSDLFASQIDSSGYDVVVSRPFGKVYGDLSFRVSNFGYDLPTFTPGAVNPARLYSGTLTIDAVDELHPPILLANKGVYQVKPGSSVYSTDMQEVGGTTVVDPYNINEEGWVRIPAGSKVVLLGRVYLLDREYAVKVNPTGTSYCYLRRFGDNIEAIASDVLREVNNGEVMFGTAVNGVLTVDESYIVMDKHVLRRGRRGSAIPVFEDNGGLGTNNFFTKRDMS